MSQNARIGIEANTTSGDRAAACPAHSDGRDWLNAVHGRTNPCWSFRAPYRQRRDLSRRCRHLFEKTKGRLINGGWRIVGQFRQFYKGRCMSGKAFGIRSRRVVTPQGVVDAVVIVDDATISGVVPAGEAPPGLPVEDVGALVVMPGLVDSHVHVNEPGRTEWEGFVTATQAAAAGGITTIADMPLNCHPVTTTLEAFKIKLDAVSGKLFVDCAFYGGVVPGNTDQLLPLVDAGVVGFKCFLIHSGIHEFPNATQADLEQAMPVLARAGVPLLVHAELEHGDQHHAQWHDATSYAQYVASRPRRWENDAIKLMLQMCEQFKCKVHIVHLSSSETTNEIKAARQRGLPFTVETCPHYLTFAAEDIPDGDTRFKCAPPIRERENRERLWKALSDGTIDIVVSDHSPCTPDLKHLDEGDLQKAWGGISSLQFRLPTVWSEAEKRGHSLEDIIRWLCSAPAEFLALGRRKGKLAAGYDADIVVWDPEAKAVFDQTNIYHRHKVTPYESMSLRGLVKQTYLRGRRVFSNGEVTQQPHGQVLLRQPAGVV
jgi:allantoinase